MSRLEPTVSDSSLCRDGNAHRRAIPDRSHRDPIVECVSQCGAKSKSALSYQVYRATKNFGALNGVRAICCLMVVKEHSHWIIGWSRSLNYGYLGVDMFFVISGFLIVTLMLREKEKNGKINVRKFYMRRALRIFPIYYCVIFGFLFFYLAVSYRFPNGWNYYRSAFPVLLTYTQDVVPANLGDLFHTWSLAMEEQFYLLWPAVERFMTGWGQWTALLMIFTVSQLSNFGYFNSFLAHIYGHGEPFLQVYQVTFTPIAGGVALAYILHCPRSFGFVDRILGGRWSFLPVLIVGLLLLELSPDAADGWSRLSIQLIFVVLLATLVLRPDHHAMTFLGSSILARLGVISYGIYVYHVPIIGVLSHLHLQVSQSTFFIVASTMTIGVAELSFRLLERRFLGLRSAYRN